MIIMFAFAFTVAPVILIPPEDLTVVSPDDATFFCEATARPGPNITWWRVEEDGNLNQIMEATGVYDIVTTEMGERVRNSTLVVIGSQPSDTGTYLCQAGNVVAMDSASVNLTVYGKFLSTNFNFLGISLFVAQEAILSKAPTLK